MVNSGLSLSCIPWIKPSLLQWYWGRSGNISATCSSCPLAVQGHGKHVKNAESRRIQMTPQEGGPHQLPMKIVLVHWQQWFIWNMCYLVDIVVKDGVCQRKPVTSLKPIIFSQGHQQLNQENSRETVAERQASMQKCMRKSMPGNVFNPRVISTFGQSSQCRKCWNSLRGITMLTGQAQNMYLFG